MCPILKSKKKFQITKSLHLTACTLSSTASLPQAGNNARLSYATGKGDPCEERDGVHRHAGALRSP